MKKFKVGDRVVRKNNLNVSNGYVFNIGDTGTIIETPSNSLFHVKSDKDGYVSTFNNINNIELITSKIQMTNSLITKLKLSKLGEPKKSFVQKGIMTIEGVYTTEGQELFDDFIKTKFEEEFNTKVVSVIDVEEAK